MRIKLTATPRLTPLQPNMHFVSGKASFAIKRLIEKITASGQMSRREHIQLTCALLSTTPITTQDRAHITRLLDAAQTGKLKLVD